MRGMQAVLAAFAVVALAACGRGGDAYEPTAEFVQDLREKARRLAESELRRLNEAEQAYKDVLSMDNIPDFPENPDIAVYFKSYRKYTRCTVTDIVRTNSFLYPISYELAFDYELYNTPLRHNALRDSPQKAAQDTEYELFRTATVNVSYPSDIRGNPVEFPPGRMPHENLLMTPQNAPDKPVASQSAP